MSLSDFPCCVAAALSSEPDGCLRNSSNPSAGLTKMEEDSCWGRKYRGVHGALESQEGPEKRSQVGLHRELECINYGTRLHFIIIQKSFQLVIKQAHVPCTNTHSHSLSIQASCTELQMEGRQNFPLPAVNITAFLLHLDHRLEVSPLTRTSKLHGEVKVY